MCTFFESLLVLDKLKKYNIAASFFLIGMNITEETKAIMQREISSGCEIANHSWSHPWMSDMSKADIINEIQKTSDTIYAMAGVHPKFFRPRI